MVIIGYLLLFVITCGLGYLVVKYAHHKRQSRWVGLYILFCFILGVISGQLHIYYTK